MSKLTGTSDQERVPERRVKSVNFLDPDLFSAVMERVDTLYGGNFSGYVIDLIKRDLEISEPRRAMLDLEELIHQIIEPYGGRWRRYGEPLEYQLPLVGVTLKVRARFPRLRREEYRLVSAIQKMVVEAPGSQIVLGFPSHLARVESQRFRQFEGAGIDNLKVCDLDELGGYLASLPRLGRGELIDPPIDEGKTGA